MDMACTTHGKRPTTLVGKPEEKRLLGRPWNIYTYGEISKWIWKGTGWECVNLMHPA
jgi:hypothetical protein